MKPREILEKKDIDLYGRWYVSQAPTKKAIYPYLDKDCIVAYRDSFFGFVFVIKSSKSFFAFAGMIGDMYFGGMEYVFRRIKLKQALRLLEDERFKEENKKVVLDEDLYDKIRNKIILEALD